MKTHKKFDNKINTITPGRWATYAAAGAATALTCANSADAEIHYSGRIDTFFPPEEDKSVAFQLEERGNFIFFEHHVSLGSSVFVDLFGAAGLQSGAFAGIYPRFPYAYVWRARNRDRYISRAHFTYHGGFGGKAGTMVRASRSTLNWPWYGEGTDFVGFRFNNGAGIQYGWARVRMDGAASRFSFTVLDYAWADPGEPIKAGQTSSTSSVTLPKQKSAAGSLGLLAFGSQGLDAWRVQRTHESY